MCLVNFRRTCRSAPESRGSALNGEGDGYGTTCDFLKGPEGRPDVLLGVLSLNEVRLFALGRSVMHNRQADVEMDTVMSIS